MDRVRIIFAWYDFWVGFFWDKEKRRLYVFPVPCLGILIQFQMKDIQKAGSRYLRPRKLESGLIDYDRVPECICPNRRGPAGGICGACNGAIPAQARPVMLNLQRDCEEVMGEPSLIDKLVQAFHRTLAEAVSSPRVEVAGDGHATLFDGAGLQFSIAMTFTPPGDEYDER